MMKTFVLRTTNWFEAKNEVECLEKAGITAVIEQSNELYYDKEGFLESVYYVYKIN